MKLLNFLLFSLVILIFANINSIDKILPTLTYTVYNETPYAGEFTIQFGFNQGPCTDQVLKLEANKDGRKSVATLKSGCCVTKVKWKDEKGHYDDQFEKGVWPNCSRTWTIKWGRPNYPIFGTPEKICIDCDVSSQQVPIYTDPGTGKHNF